MIIKTYASYAEMMADPNPGDYAVLQTTGVKFKNDNGKWRLGVAVPNDPIMATDTSSSTEDCSAFEVFAHDYDIPVGECEELGGYVTFAIPACMTHVFNVRSEQDPTKQTAFVDWGDGAITKLSDLTPAGNVGNYNYYLNHTYATTGKYIVKVYGNTYFALAQGQTPGFHTDNNAQNNLLCRVLENDLNVASHLNNFSSFAFNAQRLIKLNVFGNKFESQAKNISSCFARCKNLISVTGFSKDNNISIAERIFAHDTALTTTDFRIPRFTNRNHPGYEFFINCSNLSVDIAKLLPLNGFVSDTIDLRRWFSGCGKLYGTVPANLLWENTKINWISVYQTDNVTFYYPFDGCSADIRAQVPVSWGGTNKMVEAEIQLKKLKVNFDDYTAFEVLPHTDIIPTGSLIKDTILAGNVKDSTVLNSALKYDVVANTVHKMRIRTSQINYAESDVVIDWGDGTIETVSGQNFVKSSIDEVTKEGEYAFEHDYADSLAAENLTSKRYIVRIFGSQYYNIGQVSSNPSNLISRCFEIDLPIASHIGNLATFCNNTNQLVYVNCECIKYRKFENCQLLFANATNLVKVIGMGTNFSEGVCSIMFNNAYSLVYTDFKMGLNGLRTSLRQVFYRCLSLNMNISSLFSDVYSNNGKIDASYMFEDCPNLTGTVPAHILWNNKNIEWTNTSACFSGCSDAIRAQVPVSWGGTASDDIIEQSSSAQDVEQNARIAALETHLGMN